MLSRTKQQTIADEVVFRAIGVHSGASVEMLVLPAQADTGIVFRRTDLDSELRSVTDIVARVESVCDAELATSITNAAFTRVSTIEHLMAAFHGLGIDNALVEIDAAEVPIMDGSAAPFVEGLLAVGIVEQTAPLREIRILRTIEVVEDDRLARLEPADGFSINCQIEYDTPLVAQQRFEFVAHNGAFISDISPARTFGFADQVEQLRSRGLARGASLENAVVISGERVLNEGGLRYADEFVRHKVLDCLGDIYLLGAPVRGHMTTRYAGHALNHALVRALAADPGAWEYVTVAEEDSEKEAIPALAALG